jgi:hypothetical protein
VLFFIYDGMESRSDVRSARSQGFIRTAEAASAGTIDRPDFTDRITLMAKEDHAALLKWAIANYKNNTRDYRAVFYKQERIDGKLKKQEKISIKFREDPFSLLMKWLENPGPADKLLYVEKPNSEPHENKMRVHPSGLFSWIKSVERDPRGKAARKSSRRTCDQFGFHRTMESLLQMYEQAQQNGDLQIRHLGPSTVDNRPCVRMERLLPQKEGYPYARLVMDFDVEYLLPTAVECYDWQGNLLLKSTYAELAFNCGLTSAAFSAKANGL